MPMYQYRCNSCNSISKVQHSSSEKCSECPVCSSKEIVKFYGNLDLRIVSVSKKESGKYVKKAIEENAEVLKDLKTQRIEV